MTRNIFIIFAFLASQTVLADTPKCDNIGTKAEGWYFRGNLIAWDNCAHEQVQCDKNKSVAQVKWSPGVCAEVCKVICVADCRIVNGEKVCDDSCSTICEEACN